MTGELRSKDLGGKTHRRQRPFPGGERTGVTGLQQLHPSAAPEGFP